MDPKKLEKAMRLLDAIESSDAVTIDGVAADLIIANNPKYAAAGPLIAVCIMRLLKRAAGEGGGWLSRLFGR